MKRWITTTFDHEKANELAHVMHLPLPLATILVNRGYSAGQEVARFLNPRLCDIRDPFLLPDMDKAGERIWRAIEREEAICIHGDYDADGITATTILVQVLSALGGRVTPVLPNRLSDGYGLTPETVERCVSDAGAQLIITVDCGIGASNAVEHARSLDVDVVVTDHHESTAELPPAVAVVNPKLGDDPATQSLAGVGVAFKLAYALVKMGRDHHFSRAMELDLRNVLDLVAMGTVADIVPLLDENRILVHYGMQQLNKTQSVGLLELIRVSGIRTPIDSYHIAFILAPRLNAAGRMDTAEDALALLLTNDSQNARELAEKLDSMNRERQVIERETLEEAIRLIETSYNPSRDFGLVVAGKNWHPGVVGIVASRILHKYYRPTVVIAMENAHGGRGSCRSIDHFDMLEGLKKCDHHLVKFGGHQMAAGLEIEQSQINAFRQSFNRVVHETVKREDLVPIQKIDAWIDLGQADHYLMDALEQLKPLGEGNPPPVWAVADARVLGQPRVVGNKHLKMTLTTGGAQREAIGFGMAKRTLPDSPLNIAFQLSRNHYVDHNSVQLHLQDFEAANGNGQKS